MSDSLIPSDYLDRAARRFKVLSEPARLDLLNVLHESGEMRVGDIVDATDQHQATVSKHLGRMAEEGLLARRKEGLYVHYRIADPTLPALAMLVCGRLKEQDAPEGGPYADRRGEKDSTADAGEESEA